MPSASVPVLPRWLVVGLLLGLLLATLVAMIFTVGTRLFPERADRSRNDRIRGEDRKRREIRNYLRAIGERFVEDHRIADETVAFYLPDRDVAITFDAQKFFRINRTETTAVLVEYEMPVAHLGARLPFETPDYRTRSAATDPGADPTDAVTRAAFAVLELPLDATHADVRSAYREKVKSVHPDKGGSREAFRQVREAYRIASVATMAEADDQPASTTS